MTTFVAIVALHVPESAWMAFSPRKGDGDKTMTDKQISHADIVVEGYYISLTKLVGKQIADVVGSLTNEFDEPCFAMHKIVFHDGTSLFCEGEHDMPYLANYGEEMPNYDEETLKRLYDEEHEGEEE